MTIIDHSREKAEDACFTAAINNVAFCMKVDLLFFREYNSLDWNHQEATLCKYNNQCSYSKKSLM